MVATVKLGLPSEAIVDWSGSLDDEGYREYKISFLVLSDYNDGPANVLRAFGLPTPGSWWFIRGDMDLWAWCKPGRSAKRHEAKNGEKSNKWIVECTFTNKPNDVKSQRCIDQQIQDPLFEPMKVSGSTHKDKVEKTHDRYLRPYRYSSHEQIRGPVVEFDEGNDVIKIEQNVANLQLDLCTSMRDTVNAFTLWGLPPRCIKLSSFEWEKKIYGQCYYYYTRKFEFEARVRRNPITLDLESGWDRIVMDEGHKVLNGKWDDSIEGGRWLLQHIGGQQPDPDNPQHFMRMQDRQGNLIKIPLNGSGLPAGVIVQSSNAGKIYYVAVDTVAANTPLTKSSKWKPVIGNPFDINVGVDNKSYPKGSLVVLNVGGSQSIYLALVNTFSISITEQGSQFLIYQRPDTAPNQWKFIIDSSELVDNGEYNTSNTYISGDVVYDANIGTKTGQGTIQIQNFYESDFLQLGIPVIL